MHPIVLALVCLTLLAAAHGREQIALVIGNSNYEGDAKLDNPANDAAAMARELRKLKFTDVIEVIDGDRAKMEEGLSRFLGSLGPEKLGFFYYAGHGVQIDGANYLLPVGTTFERAYDVKYKSISLDQILDALDEAGSLPNAIVLDCCRNNPFRGLVAARGVRGEGLAEVRNQQGTLVAFSTAAGTTAADQDRVLKDHSPYTAAMLLELRGPSAGSYEMATLFRNVAIKVHQATGQDPLLNIPGSVGNYDLQAGNFVGKAGDPVAAPTTAAISQTAAMERIKQMELQGEAKAEAMQAQMAAMAAKMADLEKQAREPKIVVMQPSAAAPAPTLPDASFVPQPMPSSRSVPVYESPWLFPDSDSRYLSPSEITALSAEERWTARNEIFARRGFIFSTSRGQNYARTLGSEYQGVTRDQDSLFERMNSYERSNVELIRRYE